MNLYTINNIANLGEVADLQFVTQTDKAIIAGCRIFDVRPHEVRSRRRRCARARHAVWWALYNSTSLSLPNLGKSFGRDHTTVLYGVKQAEILRETDSDFRAKTDLLLQQVGTA